MGTLTEPEQKKHDAKHDKAPEAPAAASAPAPVPAPDAEAPKVVKSRWTQPMIVTLSNAFNLGGVSAARNAFPNKTSEEVDAKLSSLGLTALTKEEQDELDKLLARVMTHRDPRKALVFIRAQAATMISRLNNPASQLSSE